MAFSPIGMVVGAALARDIKDRGRASQIEILGGVMGASPMGLVLLATLAKEATGSGPIDPTKPNPPDLASVPDVRPAGSDLAVASEILTVHGLASGRPRAVLSDSPQGTILGSIPELGAFVALTTEVSVLISAGLLVPPVTGKLRADAEAVLKTAGFLSRVQSVDVSGTPDTVTEQDPVAGDFASSGDVITLSVVKASADGPEKASNSTAKAKANTSPSS
ncbi:PASTA domain-containing protein [Arthrobacter sp. H35-D1]|uniref:PASTA domain-containing protein n=1 Tax=Arthrobacter sp. H35-D1 TaxID=3046202 RepID=UPI0024BA0D35|nr:PASTA domain-containing protein [Arthrobacter sp. H35-D1]MDJ0314629.1 PASTA domain-containing protein [Arthrobacter sp. H35-D1]